MTPTPLGASVTLDEVLAVVATKRVPLAPELAGYIALELAEAPAARDRGVEPHHVYIGDEGTVAIVHAKADLEDGAEPDPDTSIRALLGKLLEAGGANTPALAAVARNKAGAGTAGLARELEAALIPVNRSAGRRALARLARECKRVTLNLGRNAMRSASNEVPAPAPVRPPPAPEPAHPVEPEPAPGAAAPSGDGGRPRPSAPPGAAPSHEVVEPAKAEARPDAVDGLVARFEVSGERGDKALSAELKKMAGLEPTPPPPGLKANGDDDSANALLGAATAPEPGASATRESGRPSEGDRQHESGHGPRAGHAVRPQGSFSFWRIVALLAVLAAVVWLLSTLR